jgi:carboxyl-terminal processing protease
MKKISNSVLAITFGIVIFTLGFVFAKTIDFAEALQNDSLDEYKILKTFSDVLGLVEKNYVESVEIEALVEGAIKGMLATLDPHTGYMNSKHYTSLKEETSGEFGGLGIEITVKEGVLTVVAPIEDSPAFKAGVQSGDQIVKIEEEFTKNLSIEDAVKKMRGPKGTSVTISVSRKGKKELRPITVVRDIIKVKSVRFRTLGDGFGYIRLAQFQEGSSDEFRQALKDLDGLNGSTLKGLIIDVRNNPGGLLNQAIRIADLFLKEGVVVYTEGRLESQKQKFYAHNDKIEPGYPIIVLVNEGSASASEIIAGALQDHGRALILGKQTFGKGSVQTVLPMESGDALRLTTALYYTKSGRSIQAEGITPDIEVEMKRVSDEDRTQAESSLPRVKEKDLPGAIKNPGTVSGTQKKDDEESIKSDEIEPLTVRSLMSMDFDKLLLLDSQLDEAYKLLVAWNRFGDKVGFHMGMLNSSEDEVLDDLEEKENVQELLD